MTWGTAFDITLVDMNTSQVTMDTKPVTMDTSQITMDTNPVTMETSQITMDTNPVTIETNPLTSQKESTMNVLSITTVVMYVPLCGVWFLLDLYSSALEL